jgi:hypothetical protein
MRKNFTIMASTIIGAIFLMVGTGATFDVSAQIETDRFGATKPLSDRSFPHNKNNSSEFSSMFGVSLKNLSEFNDRLAVNDAPTFNSVNVLAGFQYMKTIEGGWALAAEIIFDISQTKRNEFLQNQLTYNHFKVMGGKDLLKNEDRRLILFAGIGLGGSTFSSTLRRPEALSFDDIVSQIGPRNSGRVESTIFSTDFRLQYDRLHSLREGTKYDRWSWFLGYHLPFSTINRMSVTNIPDFRPQGVYLGWIHTWGRMNTRQ